MNTPTDLPDEDFERHLREAVALPEVPPALTHAALALWAGQPVPLATGLLRRLQAVLSLDSWAQPGTALGLRGLRSPTRQLLFSAEGCDIDLRVSPAGEAFDLSGQVLGPYDSGQVGLVPLPPDCAPAADPPPEGAPAPDQPRHATLDALGEFRLEAVPAGRYQLRLQLGHDDIVLPPIEVGPEPG